MEGTIIAPNRLARPADNQWEEALTQSYIKVINTVFH